MFDMNNNQYKNIASSLIKLPVLDVMVDKLTAIDPSPLINTVVVYIHHALGTSLNLLDAIFSLGLVPSNTFVLGKHYSENREVVHSVPQFL